MSFNYKKQTPEEIAQRRCIGIFGPEHTGTKALLNLLIDGFGGHGKRGGCGHEYVRDLDPLLVFKYSLPTGEMFRGPWPSPKKIIQEIMLANYQDIRILIPVRDYWCLYNSHCQNPAQLAEGHEQRQRKNFDMIIAQGYLDILNELQQTPVPFYFVSYEAMVTNPERFLYGLSHMLELPIVSTDIEVFDGNEKYNELIKIDPELG